MYVFSLLSIDPHPKPPRCADGFQIGAKGHRIMADLINAYVDMQVCEIDNGYGVTEIPELPRVRLIHHRSRSAVLTRAR